MAFGVIAQHQAVGSDGRREDARFLVLHAECELTVGGVEEMHETLEVTDHDDLVVGLEGQGQREIVRSLAGEMSASGKCSSPGSSW